MERQLELHDLLGRLFLKGTLLGVARSQDTAILADELPSILACFLVSISNLYKKQLYADALIRHLIMPPTDMAETDTGCWEYSRYILESE